MPDGDFRPIDDLLPQLADTKLRGLDELTDPDAIAEYITRYSRYLSRGWGPELQALAAGHLADLLYYYGIEPEDVGLAIAALVTTKVVARRRRARRTGR